MAKKTLSKEIVPFVEQDKNKLSMVETPISQDQILKIFQKTPADHVYTRPAKGGGTWDYVTGVYVKKVLNYIFGFLWDFEVKEHGREGDLIWVLGRLTIKNKEGVSLVAKEQFGRAEVKFKKNSKTPLDIGNDMKAATTDALKKCASELGIASDIYGKNEFKEVKIVKEEPSKSEQQKKANIGAAKKKLAKIKNDSKTEDQKKVDKIKDRIAKDPKYKPKKTQGSFADVVATELKKKGGKK